MTKHVLSIGQCGADHGSISRFLKRHFDVEISAAHRDSDAFEQLSREEFDLVLINRKLDADYSDGMQILGKIKSDSAFDGLPVMLVSNFSDAQSTAVKAGAIPGFGKSELDAPEVVERLREFLA